MKQKSSASGLRCWRLAAHAATALAVAGVAMPTPAPPAAADHGATIRYNSTGGINPITPEVWCWCWSARGVREAPAG